MAKIYLINYNSENEYEEPVKESIFNYLVTPCNDESQTLLDFTIHQSAEEEPFYCKNTFGFQAIRIRSKKPFKKFSFSFNAKVQKQDQPLDLSCSPPFEEQLAEIKSRNFFIEHHFFLSKTHYTFLSSENAKNSFRFKRDTSIFDYLTGLNSFINSYLSYEPDTTNVYTNADEVMQNKKGVCQDYTHLFLAMARESGIPCRYVSGYLDQGTEYIGGAMMHAWAEAYVPGCGWIGFDPTNNIWVNHHYIKVAHGIDYNDCSPIKGVLHTKGNNNTVHQVTVSQQ